MKPVYCFYYPLVKDYVSATSENAVLSRDRIRLRREHTGEYRSASSFVIQRLVGNSVAPERKTFPVKKRACSALTQYENQQERTVIHTDIALLSSSNIKPLPAGKPGSCHKRETAETFGRRVEP